MSQNSNPYILFDIGGTHMRVAISFDGRELSHHKILSTPRSYSDGINLLCSTIKELTSSPLQAIVGGMAGSLTKDKDMLFRAPHLRDWEEKGIKKDISDQFGCPVFLENDTALVGLGEATHGAGKDFEIVVYVTVSTGVNGVKIVKKHLDTTVFSPEIGHQILDFDANQNFVDYGRGELEDFVAGTALEKRHQMRPAEIKDPYIWENCARMLAYGLYNATLFWSPEIIVIGGAMSKRISLDLTQNFLNELVRIFPFSPKIVLASLGDIGGLYGALSILNIDEKRPV